MPLRMANIDIRAILLFFGSCTICLSHSTFCCWFMVRHFSFCICSHPASLSLLLYKMSLLSICLSWLWLPPLSLSFFFFILCFDHRALEPLTHIVDRPQLLEVVYRPRRSLCHRTHLAHVPRFDKHHGRQSAPHAVQCAALGVEKGRIQVPQRAVRIPKLPLHRLSRVVRLGCNSFVVFWSLLSLSSQASLHHYILPR